MWLYKLKFYLKPNNWKWLEDIKKFLYYKKHGYFPEDWFNYNGSNAMRTVMSLTRLRDSGIAMPLSEYYSKVSSDEDDREVWKNILSDIIFAWEEVLICLWDKDELINILGKERLKHIGTFKINDIKYNVKLKQFEKQDNLTTLDKSYILRSEYNKSPDNPYYTNNNTICIQSEEHYKRMLRGFALYRKHYMSLWD